MKKIGLIVAIEMDSIFEHYTKREELDCPKGFNLYKVKKSDSEIYILQTGMGEIASAAGTQYLITKCGVEVVVNFGVVGGLTDDMSKQRICVVDRVVHYRYDCSEFLDLKIGQVDKHPSIFLPTDLSLVKKALETEPELKKVTCCSGDKFVSKAEDKHNMHIDFEGDVCDMESAGIVLTCEANGVPCLLLKAVSDGLSGGAKEFFDELKDASDVCLKVADKIIGVL